MAQTLRALLALTLTLAVVTAGNKFAMSHSVILDKFNPIVKDFSVDLANQLDSAGSDVQTEAYKIIKQTLASQVDELVTKGNSSNISMCCTCAKCTRTCSACGRSCCCSGSGGCSCRSCSSLDNGMDLTLDSVEDGSRPTSLDLWSAATKDLLVRELRAVVAVQVPSANSKCCACSHCKQYVPGVCGFPLCCASGKVCVCKTCARNDIIQMASVDQFVSLTSQAEEMIKPVRHLVDQLVALIWAL